MNFEKIFSPVSSSFQNFYFLCQLFRNHASNVSHIFSCRAATGRSQSDYNQALFPQALSACLFFSDCLRSGCSLFTLLSKISSINYPIMDYTLFQKLGLPAYRTEAFSIHLGRNEKTLITGFGSQ